MLCTCHLSILCSMQVIALPPNFFELKISQRGVNNKRESSRQPDADISARVVANQCCHWSNEVHLIHTDNGTDPPNQKRNQRRKSNR